MTIQGQRQYLWRAVDQDGDTLDILVQRRRNQREAERFFRRLLKGQGGEPRWLVTDKLRSYDAATSYGHAHGEAHQPRLCEQPSRSLARTDSPARTGDAKISFI